MLLCFISDPVGVQLVDRIGSRQRQPGRWTTPTPTRRGRTVPRTSHRDIAAAGLSDDDIDNITHRTAMRWFDYDPFAAHLARADATVGALRARPTATTSRSARWAGAASASAALNIGEMSKMADGR